MSKKPYPPPLLNLRAALVLFVSIVVGADAGVLTALAGRPGYEAVLTGFAAGVASIKMLHSVVGS